VTLEVGHVYEFTNPLTKSKHEVLQMGANSLWDLKGNRLAGVPWPRNPEQFRHLGLYEEKPSSTLLGWGARNAVSPMTGSDPEFFLRQGGQDVAAFFHLPPKEVRKGGWFWDGFQAETTVPARHCHQEFAVEFKKQLALLAGQHLEPRAATVWEVPQALMDAAGENHVSFGCSPSLNAYGHKGLTAENPRALLLRFAGGHVHEGWTNLQRCFPDVEGIVKTMDVFAGVACVALARNFDNPLRRRYYGLAGEYRLPSHGLEYRTLSNFWLYHPLSFQLVLGLTRHAFSMGANGFRKHLIGTDNEVSTIIDNCDVPAAVDLVHLNEGIYKAWHDCYYGGGFETFLRAVDRGIDKVIPDFGKDIPTAWASVRDAYFQPTWCYFAAQYK